MAKKNCWEIKKCGRQRGGEKVEEFGECPVSCYHAAHGINDGINGGRICWAIAGTLCHGYVSGELKEKMWECANCTIAHQVHMEEGDNFIGNLDGIKKAEC